MCSDRVDLVQFSFASQLKYYKSNNPGFDLFEAKDKFLYMFFSLKKVWGIAYQQKIMVKRYIL